jgi:hypothetical protein
MVCGQTGSDEESLYYLNINREVTALTSGQLGAAGGGDTLLVGTPSNLQVSQPPSRPHLINLVFWRTLGTTCVWLS